MVDARAILLQSRLFEFGIQFWSYNYRERSLFSGKTRIIESGVVY